MFSYIKFRLQSHFIVRTFGPKSTRVRFPSVVEGGVVDEDLDDLVGDRAWLGRGGVVLRQGGH